MKKLLIAFLALIIATPVFAEEPPAPAEENTASGEVVGGPVNNEQPAQPMDHGGANVGGDMNDHHGGQGNFEGRREKWRDLSPQEREAMRQDFQQNHPKAFERMQQMKTELDSLPPQEREARIKELRAQYRGQREERRERFEQKWEGATPEKRNEFCNVAQQRCQEGKRFACHIVEKKCNR